MPEETKLTGRVFDPLVTVPANELAVGDVWHMSGQDATWNGGVWVQTSIGTSHACS